MTSGKTGADDVVRQVLKAFVVVGPDGGATIHVKAAVTPREHIFNESIIDFALGLERLVSTDLKIDGKMIKNGQEQRGKVDGAPSRSLVARFYTNCGKEPVATLVNCLQTLALGP